MCLLFAILTLLGPRALVFFWWILEPARWAATFQSAFIPVIGFLFLPWTTIMYVLVFPGGIEGLDWIWLGLGLRETGGTCPDREARDPHSTG